MRSRECQYGQAGDDCLGDTEDTQVCKSQESEFEIVLVPSASLVSIVLVISMMMTSVTPKNVLLGPLGAILINVFKHVGL